MVKLSRRQQGKFFDQVKKYQDLATQKQTLLTHIEAGKEHPRSVKSKLRLFLKILTQQIKTLAKVNSAIDGEIAFFTETNDLIAAVQRGRLLEDRNFQNFETIVAPVVREMLDNDLVTAIDLYRTTICPGFREAQQAAQSLTEEEREAEEHTKLEQQVLVDIHSNLALQVSEVTKLAKTRRNDVLDPNLLRTLVAEEIQKFGLVMADARFLSGLFLRIDEGKGKVKTAKLRAVKRWVHFIRLVFGSLPAGIAVWVAVVAFTPQKHTALETERIFQRYTGKTPSEIVRALDAEDLPADIRTELIAQVQGKVKEIPSGGRAQVHEPSFDKVVEEVTNAYTDALMRTLRAEYEKQIPEIQKTDPSFVPPDIDWDEVRGHLSGTILRFERPTLLAKMKEIRRKENFVDYLKRTGMRPTWTNQVEKDLERWVSSRVTQVFQDLKRSINQEIKEWLTPEFIREIQKSTETREAEPHWVLTLLGDIWDTITTYLVVLLLLGSVCVVFKPTRKALRFTFFYLIDVKSGMLKDVRYLCSGYVVEQTRRE